MSLRASHTDTVMIGNISTMFELDTVQPAAAGVITLSRRRVAHSAAIRRKAFFPSPSAIANVDADDFLAHTLREAKFAH